MSAACLPAKAASFSYAPGAALCRFRASSDNCVCALASSTELVATSGADVAGLHPVRQGAAFGFLDFLCFVCAEAPDTTTSDSAATIATAANFRAAYFRAEL